MVSFLLLVNLIEANLFPSFFHSLKQVVSIPSHSSLLRALCVFSGMVVAYSKAMFAMFLFRYLSFFLNAFLAFLEFGLSSILPCSFLCAVSSCLS